MATAANKDVYIYIYCYMSTAIKHPVLDRVKPSFVIFDIRALWRSSLSVRVPGCQKLTNDGLANVL